MLAAGAALMLRPTAAALAEGGAADYPNRPVKIIVPFPAGGTADFLPRVVGEKLGAKWGQSVIIENRPGAGGNIGADYVAQAEPDGYTLLSSPPGPLAINQNLYKTLAYDPTKFVPITVLAEVPNVLVVNPQVPAKTVKELIALAKKQPGTLTYASQGNGSTSHLTGAMFEAMAGVDLVHVPYKGTAPALTDLLGGHVDMSFDNLASTLHHHRSGKLRILAVDGPKRSPALPEVPTMEEAGVPGFRSVTWFAMVAPPGAPASLAERIRNDVAEILATPEVRNRFLEQGAEPIGDTPAEMAAFVAEERKRWGDVIRSAHVTIE
jgi:tripartite-type tricarboxylate transporter receptor subunit TctC